LSKIKLVLHTSIVTQVTEFQNFIRGKGSEEFKILQQDYDCSVQQKYKESYVEEKKKDVLIEEKFSEEELFAAVYLVYMLDTNKDIPLRFLFILSCLSRDEVNGILLFLMPIQFTVNKEAVTNLKWVIMQNINDRLIGELFFYLLKLRFSYSFDLVLTYKFQINITTRIRICIETIMRL